MNVENIKTLEEAKQYLRDHYKEGTDCPCCKQYVKEYKRKLNSGMARTLFYIYDKTQGGQYLNVKDFLRRNSLKNNHDWTLLRYWGLIEERPSKDDKQKSSGEWRITDNGIQFVRNRLKVPSHIKIYNNKFRGYNDEHITIIEALGKHFDYEELINS